MIISEHIIIDFQISKTSIILFIFVKGNHLFIPFLKNFCYRRGLIKVKRKKKILNSTDIPTYKYPKLIVVTFKKYFSTLYMIHYKGKFVFLYYRIPPIYFNRAL